MVDICVVEFDLVIFYFYLIYVVENELLILDKVFILVLGLGLI